jgi:hypothetical protein
MTKAQPNKSKNGANGNGRGSGPKSGGGRGSSKAKNGGKSGKSGHGSANGRKSDTRAGATDDRQGSRRRKGSRKKRVDPTVFWGDPDKLAEVRTDPALISANPSAVVQSLGRAPLAGQQNAADLYFAAVYDRSVNLAAALAAAGGLLEPDDLA